MIGIIILNYKTSDETIDCVESIRNNTKCNYKIYIVDNNSPDDSFYQLSLRFHDSSDVILLKSEKNGGYSAGNNIGISRALSDNADVIILSNSDVIFYDGSIDHMYKYLKNNNNIGILGPKVMLENGKMQNSPRKNYTFKNYLFGKKPFLFIDFKQTMKDSYFNNYEYDSELIFNGFVAGCCIALTKEYFESCGLLDEEVFLYYEEPILSYKALNAGLQTCVLPQAVVLHKCSVSIGKQISAFSRYHRYYSSMYMLKKYTGINNFQLLFIFLLNLAPFLTNSLTKRDYRVLLKEYLQNGVKLFQINNKM